MNENDKNESKDLTLTPEQLQEIMYENMYLKEKERLWNLKENIKDKSQFQMYMIEKLENQNQLLLTLNENLLVLIDKLKVGLNSTNQQLYNLTLALAGESGTSEVSGNTISTESIDSTNEDVAESYEEDDPFDDSNEPEPKPDEEEPEDDDTLKSDELDRLPETQKGYFKQLEEKRMALKKMSMKKGRETKINDEKLQKEMLEQKRMEARAKLKAEEILTKKELEENKKSPRHIPEEMKKRFFDKFYKM